MENPSSPLPWASSLSNKLIVSLLKKAASIKFKTKQTKKQQQNKTKQIEGQRDGSAVKSSSSSYIGARVSS